MADEVEVTDDQAGAGSELEAGTVTEAEAAALEAGGEGSDGSDKADESDKADDKKVVFTPEQQAVFSARLGKEIGKRERAEQAAEAARVEAEAAKARVSEHEAAVAQGLHLHPSLVSPEDLRLIQAANGAEAEHAALGEVAGEDDVEVAGLPESTQAWLKKTHPGETQIRGSALAPRMAQLTQAIAKEGGRADAIYNAAKARQATALSLGLQILKLREEAARKVKTDGGGDGKPKGSQVPLKSAQRPVTTGAETRKGVINRAAIAAGGGTTQALIEAMGD